MKTRIAYVFTLVVLIVSISACNTKKKSEETTTENTAPALDPRYASEETKEVIEKMIKAHGDLEKWKNSPSVSYQHTYIGPFDPSDPWTSDEIIEQGKRRVYQNWPLDKAEIFYNGKGYYSVNWKRGNPAKFTAHLAYYFSNIPWLTQDNGVKLGEVRTREIFDEPKEYIAVKMTFEPTAGESPKDYYDLMIDPETYELKAMEYVVAYGAILDAMGLPAEVEFFGPMIKKFEKYEVVDEFKVPVKLITLGPEGEDFGFHTYKNWSFTKPFTDDLVKIPENAVKDTSSSKRKKAE
ncbi:hypothetical protein [Leptobacterium sp. I13]|uniref:hypothetical protein n=1 Tax=Leptobacterium meishanense TaxID=3128904 RepID=UPI0030EBB166